ncbi:response regulator [Hirschia baltica]|uniref:Response regulator receiver protein n=1 Tax=Hirschia baltica (strain ATCC 49814 / DSM 5838 / IFAM 1418) TaxID=582402 RepID=C6XLX8_HIRBI|nr:response regulator [Hirschia baltica]ACT59810.1 response regulator receiver protein [Hirschia baltica ATCC 49814]
MGDLKAVTVLVVDDHQNMRQIWLTVLKGFGIRKIVQASDAATALEILRDQPIDIAVIDVIMPDILGTELVTLIRRADDSKNKLLPIIICTADTRRSAIYQLINAGADEILTKPVRPDAIWQRLVSVVNHRRQFLKTDTYFGPDRRRVDDPSYKGRDRRESAFL